MNETQPIVHVVTDDEISEQTKELFQKITASTGSVPKWMRVMANCEDTLNSFFSLFKTLMDDAPAPQSLKWKAAHVVSEINKCEFCLGVTKNKLKSFGINEEYFSNLEKISTEREIIAIAYAKAVTQHAYEINPEITKKLKANFSDKEIVEITSVVGLFNYINRFNDALRVLPDLE